MGQIKENLPYTLFYYYFVINLALFGMQKLLISGIQKTNFGVLRNVSRNSIEK